MLRSLWCVLLMASLTWVLTACTSHEPSSEKQSDESVAKAWRVLVEKNGRHQTFPYATLGCIAEPATPSRKIATPQSRQRCQECDSVS